MKRKKLSPKEEIALSEKYKNILKKAKERRPSTAFKEGAKGNTQNFFRKNLNGDFNEEIFEKVWKERDKIVK